jgi:hypothetical protein
MAWLHSHQALRDHPKKDRLAELLFNGSVPNDVSDLAAVGLLHCLWWWALDYAQDGDLAKFSDRQIAKGCGWIGDATLLVQALVDAGFVDKKPRRIHDWDEYGGKLLEQRERERTRVKAWRSTSSVHVPNADGTHVVQGREERVELSAGVRATTGAGSHARAKAKAPVDKSPVSVDNSEKDPICWRCGLTITGDEILDDACVLSSRGTRHKVCEVGR